MLKNAHDLTSEERDKLAEGDFAWPEERKYPIRTQQDVDSAAKLIGKAPADKQAAIKKRIIALAKKKNLTIPDDWKEAPMSADTANFEATLDLPPVKVGRYVKKRAKVAFRCGEYPDKQFSLTPEEAKTVLAGFQPVDMRVQHLPTVFDGKLGQLVALVPDEKDPAVFGA